MYHYDIKLKNNITDALVSVYACVHDSCMILIANIQINTQCIHIYTHIETQASVNNTYDSPVKFTNQCNDNLTKSILVGSYLKGISPHALTPANILLIKA